MQCWTVAHTGSDKKHVFCRAIHAVYSGGIRAESDIDACSHSISRKGKLQTSLRYIFKATLNCTFLNIQGTICSWNPRDPEKGLEFWGKKILEKGMNFLWILL